MITNYFRPQQIIRQILEVTPDPQESNINAFIFGPKYHLSRYTNEQERAEITGQDFVEAGQTLPYDNASNFWEVDTDFVKLYAEGMEALLADYNTGDDELFVVKSNEESNKVRLISTTPKSKFIYDSEMNAVDSGYSTGTSVATTSTGAGDNNLTVHIIEVGGSGEIVRFKLNGNGSGYRVGDVITITGGSATYTLTADDLEGVALRGASRSSSLFGRDVTINDLVRVSEDGTTRTRKVTGFEQEVVQATFGSNVDKNDELAANATTNPDTTTAGVSNIVDGSFSLSIVDNASWNGLVKGARYGTEYGQKYNLTVVDVPSTSVDGTVSIRSNSGLFDANAVPLTWAADPQLGIASITLSTGVPVEITTSIDHGYSTGDTVTFDSVGGTTELDGNSYVVTVTGSTTFTLDSTDGDDFTPYTSGGTAQKTNKWYEVRNFDNELNIAGMTDGGATDISVNVVSHGFSTGDRITFTNLGGANGADELDGKTYFITVTDSNNFTLDDTDGVVLTSYVDNGVCGRSQALAGVIVRITPASGSTAPTSGTTFSYVIKGDYTKLELAGTGSDDLILDGTYNGPTDTTYTITVTEGSTGLNGFTGAKVRVSDLNGVDDVQEYTITSDVANALGSYGLTFTFSNTASTVPQEGLRAGDVYTVSAVAEAATGTESIAILNGSAVDVTTWTLNQAKLTELDEVQFRILYSGELAYDATEVAWTAGDVLTGVTVPANIRYFVSERSAGNQWVPFKEDAYNSSKLFVSYRALIPASASEEVTRIGNSTELVEFAGKVDPDNTLAYGIYSAWIGSQQNYIYAASVPSNDLTGFQDVLRRIENLDNIYALCPLTYSESVITAVKDHVNEMSTELKQQWRRAYVSTKSPGSFGYVTETSAGAPYLATIAPIGSNNVRVNSDDVDFVEQDVEIGDLFRINYSGSSYEEYVVATVVGENELILESGPALPVTTGAKFELWKPDTGKTQSDYVAKRSAELSDRRVINVWVDNPIAIIDGEDPLDVVVDVFSDEIIEGVADTADTAIGKEAGDAIRNNPDITNTVIDVAQGDDVSTAIANNLGDRAAEAIGADTTNEIALVKAGLSTGAGLDQGLDADEALLEGAKTYYEEGGTVDLDIDPNLTGDLDLAFGDINIDLPDIGLEDAIVAFPAVDLPEVDIDIPEVDLPEVDVEIPEVELPEVDVPEVDIEIPEVDVPEVDIDIPEVDVEIPEVDVEIPEVDVPEVDIEIPEVDIPEVDIEIPEVDVEKPDLEGPDIDGPDISKPTLDLMQFAGLLSTTGGGKAPTEEEQAGSQYQTQFDFLAGLQPLGMLGNFQRRS